MDGMWNGGTDSRQRIDLLTSWRFFAAALVVFFHCGQPAFSESPEWFQALIQSGYQAVSFFFLLSGFILVYTYHDEDAASGLRGTTTRFWIARIARIYPTYLMALLIAFPAFAFNAFVRKTVPTSSLALDQISLPVFFSLGLVSVPVLLQAWIPPMALAWNPPAWSLSVEAFFYLSFPLWVRAIRSMSAKTCFWTALALVVAVHLGRHSAYPLPESGARPYSATISHHFFAYFPLFHLPTFLFGMTLGKLHLSVSGRLSTKNQGIVLILSLCTLLYLFCNHGKIAPVFLSDSVLVPICGAIVFSSANCAGLLRRVLSHPWLVELGEASYGMYILHLPLAWWAKRFKQAMGSSPGDSELLFFLCYLTLLIVICVLVFELFEKPARRLVTHWLRERFSLKVRTDSGKAPSLQPSP